jgi:hypothetical protein
MDRIFGHKYGYFLVDPFGILTADVNVKQAHRHILQLKRL